MRKFKGLPKSVPPSEFSEKFVQGMADRMAFSFHKYGLVANAYPHRVDAIGSLKKRLERYEADGNLEWLMDVGNFAMIEFMHPRHREAHFTATTSDESPGRKFHGEPGFSAKKNPENRFYKHEGD
jgi:hypothetical protein